MGQSWPFIFVNKMVDRSRICRSQHENNGLVLNESLPYLRGFITARFDSQIAVLASKFSPEVSSVIGLEWRTKKRNLPVMN